ncbi:MAG: hypothetical protein F4X65_02210 [Chloroflexi bacterium]|nr:hypothetical protein [Chloroflexota bacterium]
MTRKLSKKNQITSLEIPLELSSCAELFSEITGIDKSDALLDWLRSGAEREMLRLVSEGELSAGKFVELLGITYFDVPQLTEKYNIEIGPTEEQVQYMWDKHAEAVGAILKKSVKSHQEQQD